MILIQRIRKIKGNKYFRDILIDVLFFTTFFVLGVVLVFFRIEKGREVPLILEKATKDDINNEHLVNSSQINMKYVASSRGKYFYEIESSRAKSLSEKNKVYFKTGEEAKKLGFKPYFDN